MTGPSDDLPHRMIEQVGYLCDSQVEMENTIISSMAPVFVTVMLAVVVPAVVCIAFGPPVAAIVLIPFLIGTVLELRWAMALRRAYRQHMGLIRDLIRVSLSELIGGGHRVPSGTFYIARTGSIRCRSERNPSGSGAVPLLRSASCFVLSVNNCRAIMTAPLSFSAAFR